MIDVVLLKGERERVQGLIGMKPIPPRTFFVFPDTPPGTLFHSRGVLEPFDILFIDKNGKAIKSKRVIPPFGTARAPRGTDSAVEVKAGTFEELAGTGAMVEFGDLGMFHTSDVFYPTILLLAAAGLGVYGFSNRKKAWGEIALGAAGSLAAVCVAFVLKRILFPDKS